MAPVGKRQKTCLQRLVTVAFFCQWVFIDFLKAEWLGPCSVEPVPERGPRPLSDEYIDRHVSPARLVKQTTENSLKGNPMNTGTVKWFNSQKGFGFIQPDNGGPDVFVHISAVERAGMSTLNEGQKIEYEVLADRRTGKSSAGNLRAA
jgi:cold shock protein